MSDNVDRSLLEHWQELRARHAEEARFLRLVENERPVEVPGSDLEEQVARARRHVRARRAKARPLAPVVQLHAFD